MATSKHNLTSGTATETHRRIDGPAPSVGRRTVAVGVALAATVGGLLAATLLALWLAATLPAVLAAALLLTLGLLPLAAAPGLVGRGLGGTSTTGRGATTPEERRRRADPGSGLWR